MVAPAVAAPAPLPLQAQPIVCSATVKWPEGLLDDDGIPWEGGYARIRVARAVERVATPVPVVVLLESVLGASSAVPLVERLPGLSQSLVAPSRSPSMPFLRDVGLSQPPVDCASEVWACRTFP